MNQLKKMVLLLILTIVSITVYALFIRKDLTLDSAYVKQKYKQPNSHFINWNGMQLHYTESGKGFPILMIHGFGGSSWDFKMLDSLLCDKYRIIRVDMPGFGLSDVPVTNNFIKLYDDYFAFLMDTLHLDSCYVMGNSLGGLMTWNLALHFPDKVKKIVLLNSAGYDMKEALKSTNADRFKNPFLRMFLKRGIPKFMTNHGIQRIYYQKNVLTKEKLQRVNDFWNTKGHLQHIMNMVASDKYPNTDAIKTIQCPTLILWGKQDILLPSKYADRFANDIKNNTKIIYDSCGHVPMQERPLDVQRDVLKFFSE